MDKENNAVQFIEGSVLQALAKVDSLLKNNKNIRGILVPREKLDGLTPEQTGELLANAILGNSRNIDPNIVKAPYNTPDGKRMENFEDDALYYNVPMTQDELSQKRAVKEMNMSDFTKMMYSAICNANGNGDLILEAFRHYILHMKITKKGNMKLTLHNGEVIKIKVEKESKKKKK